MTPHGDASGATLARVLEADDAALAKHLHDALGTRAPALLTPALVIDLDAVDANIAAMCHRVGDPMRWRPHIKTLKQSRLIERLLASGLRRLKCATPGELALALDTGRDYGVALDLLVAYPHRGANLREVLRLCEASTPSRVHLLADDPRHLGEIRRLAPGASVFMDVDLGMARTGSPPEQWWAEYERGCPRVSGLHGYDGHFRVDEEAAAFVAYDRLLALAEELRLPHEAELVTSGTHSYMHALAHPGLRDAPWPHTVSPGTMILSDLRSDHAARELGLRQAAFVASRVVSRHAGRLTLDAGSKAITPDAIGPSARVLDHPELAPQRASEEHLPCHFDEVDAASAPRAGELVWLVPDHVCTTVNLHRQALYLRGGRYIDSGPIEAASRLPWAGSAG